MKTPTIIQDVQAIEHRDGGLLCRVGDREVLVPRADIGIADGALSKPGREAASSSRRRSRLRSAL